MSIDLTAAGSNEPRREKSAERTSALSLYKPGQGYWTRLGTALGAGAVILFIAYFTYRELAVFAPFDQSHTGRRFGVVAALVAVLAFITWWVMNAPKRAQFLIDTDSEMKKVNWAGWSELIGSTRVVVAFMLLTALTLFVFDTQFHAIFYSLRVWHISFDPNAGLATGGLLSLVLLGISVGLLRNSDSKATKIAGVMCLVVGAAALIAWALFALRGGL